MSVRMLADLLLPKPGKGPLVRQWGVVTAISTGPPLSATITLSGGTATVPGVRYLTSYAPAVNDVVLIDQDGTDIVIIGRLAVTSPPVVVTARGTVAQVTAAAASTTTTMSSTLLTETTIITTPSFTYDPARRYRVTGTLRANAGAANQSLSFRIYSGATLLAAADTFVVGTTGSVSVVVTGNTTALSGSQVIALVGTHTAGSAATPGNASGGYAPIQLWVEDIGT